MSPADQQPELGTFEHRASESLRFPFKAQGSIEIWAGGITETVLRGEIL